MTEQEDRGWDKTERLAALWICILAGPVFWFTNQQVNLWLVEWVCESGHKFILHLVSLAALLLTSGTGAIALRNWNRYGKHGEQDAGPAAPAQFMSIIGVFSSAMFSVLIIAQDLPNFLLDPCNR